ncbi:hypothetical protein [Methylotuvimicrobium sp. KM2]|uniref:hypothetical protein n=1 Tax=Methylotuvimicrobium sp. KM2 TaxID=3133976 RepID=UPI0031016371
MKQSESFPFTLEQDAVADWLSRLDVKDSIASGATFYAALKKIPHIRLGNKDLLAVLDILTPSVLLISDNLISSLLPSIIDEGSVKPKSRKLARLSSQLLRSHCLAYCHASTAQSLNEKCKAHAIFTAMQIAGLTMRTNTLISERNSSTLWQKTGELYQIARNEQLIPISLTSKIPAFKAHKSISSVLKRNLLFALFDPYPAPAERIIGYFDLADRIADLVAFEKSLNPSYNFYWDGCNKTLHQDTPAIPDENSLIFNTEAVAQHLSNFAPEMEGQDDFYFTLRQKISGYQDILDSVILSKPEAYCYTADITPICERLKHLERIFKIHRLGGPMAKAEVLSKMELVPMESEFKMLSPRQLHLSQDSGKSIKVEWINIQQTKFTQYILGHAKNEGLTAGQPILLYNQQKMPSIGIIRKKNQELIPYTTVLD